ncbi:MAG: phosphate acyltransferase PlsX, partial [Dehalococcoidales bacterium]|nr:phosphate acyltransferase PlsX [Dehalococcoidales bacterium]
QPVQALKTKPHSSIVVGMHMVKEGKASAFVSAGSTGAVLAASYMMLGRLPNIQRPTLATVIAVNPEHPFLLIDAGANADCIPAYLAQFAVMGSIFAVEHLGIEKPRVALLNNGTEEGKGNRLAKESHQLLKTTPDINFSGNIEPQELLANRADVVVTDGFTGNIVLKTLEGFGENFGKSIGWQQTHKVPRELQGSALVNYAKVVFLTKRADYKEFGGACLLGLEGNVVVAHGRSKSKAIKSAIHLAIRTVELEIIGSIKKAVTEISHSTITE